MKGERLETDVLIVGGGIVGCTAAYDLAGDGVEVMVVERHALVSQASSRNAGSVHFQLMVPPELRDNPDSAAALEQALPYFVHGNRVWSDLEADLGADFERKITGGLMVAETEADLGHLERKEVIEGRQGIESEILRGNALRDLAPYLNETALAAAWCATEGRINPLKASRAVAAAAGHRGARTITGVEVRAIEQQDGGFQVLTSGPEIRARRIVNASGAWSAGVARLLGIELPVTPKVPYLNVTERTPITFPHLVMHASRPLTLKQTRDGTVVIGGGWRAVADAACGHGRVARESIRGNLRVAADVAPGVRGLRILRTWAGINPFTDGLPYLGPVAGVPGYVNAVTAPAGYSMGPLCGRLAAELVRGRAPSIDVTAAAIDRPMLRR